MKILLLTGHRRDTEVDHILLHILHIRNDPGLHEVLTLRMAISMPLISPSDVEEDRNSFAIRTAEKVDPNRCDVPVTLSRNKLTKGTCILGYEIWKMGEDIQMHRRAQELVVDERHEYAFGQ